MAVVVAEVCGLYLDFCPMVRFCVASNPTNLSKSALTNLFVQRRSGQRILRKKNHYRDRVSSLYEEISVFSCRCAPRFISILVLLESLT